MNRSRQAAERLTGALSDSSWKPGRAHIEGARNELLKADGEIERIRSALTAVLDWYTPPNDSKPFPIQVVTAALTAGKGDE